MTDQEPPEPGRGASIACDAIASATRRATAAEIAALRKAPGSIGEIVVPPSLLRHVDEQTVVGLVALLDAVRASGLDPLGFGDWSVLSAPRFLGRATFEVAFPQYRAEGAWGVSPHLIPAHSLHSPSGTYSQVLKAHGPNLGIGGTPTGGREALLASATWLGAGVAPGLWLVATGRVDCRDGRDAISPPGEYEALAVALVPAEVDAKGIRLVVGPDAARFGPSVEAEAGDRAEIARWLDLEPAGPTFRVDPGHPLGSNRPHPSRAGRVAGARGPR